MATIGRAFRIGQMPWARMPWERLTMLGMAAFMGGFVLAVITGIWWAENAGLLAALVILGLVVGLLNISAREVLPYLIAGIGLVIVGQSDVFTPMNTVVGGFGNRLNTIVRMLALFTAPAVVVTALRASLALAQPGEHTRTS